MAPRPLFEAPANGDAGKQPGQRALIIGAASDIGRAVAHLSACQGADVASLILPMQLWKTAETAAAIRQLSLKCVHISGNVTNAGFCVQALLTTIHELGAIDVLVDNPAVQQHKNLADALSVNQWKLTFKADILACFT